MTRQKVIIDRDQTGRYINTAPAPKPGELIQAPTGHENAKPREIRRIRTVTQEEVHRHGV